MDFKGKIAEDGLDASILGDKTRVTIRGIGGAEYTELIFDATPSGASAFRDQMCSFGFANSGGYVCPGNAGYTWLAGNPHDGFQYAFRDNNAFNGLNCNLNLSNGQVACDIDQGNPAGGLAGILGHGVQVAYNWFTGGDNNYGCRP
jgi:hypothetical protein